MILLWIWLGIFGILVLALVFNAGLVAAARRSGKLPAAGKSTMADVERLARAGERIYTIRCHREIQGCGLVEAKKAIEDLNCPD